MLLAGGVYSCIAVHPHPPSARQYCSSSNPPLPPPMSGRGGEEHPDRGSPPLPFLVRAVVRMSRARWYGFLRRVFHYQNGMMRSESAAANPFNSSTWLAWEFASLLVQIAAVTVAMAISHGENPVWPLRVWLAGYNLGNLLSMPALYWRYRHSRAAVIEEQLRRGEEARGAHLMNRCRTLLELFFAVWFVMGNVWVFDAPQGGFGRAPVLHTLCVALLVWNAVGYSFPFLLFLLLRAARQRHPGLQHERGLRGPERLRRGAGDAAPLEIKGRRSQFGRPSRAARLGRLGEPNL